MGKQPSPPHTNNDPIWQSIRAEAESIATQEPLLASHLHATILHHRSLESALSFHLAQLLQNASASALLLRDIMDDVYHQDVTLANSIRCDLRAIRERDSACNDYATAFLYYKGFHALQAYRSAHWLWQQQQSSLALLLQSLMASQFSVDIHPAAHIGHGIFIDHATGIVIGATAVVGNNVSLMQSVTLGGTGKVAGDRHPKVEDGVLIGAGAKILGNIRIGEGAQIVAGSVVLKPVPAHTTVMGVPAKIVGHPDSEQPALEMDQGIE